MTIYEIADNEVAHWFVKLEDSQLTGREHNFLLSIQRWEPANRGRYTEAIDEATKELKSMGAMIL